jgi:hypothetical protein
MSFGVDNVIRIWGAQGEFLHSFAPKYTLTSLCCSPFFAFAADDHRQIHIFNLESWTKSSYATPHSIKHIAPVGDGLAALAVSDCHSAMVLGPSEIAATFAFNQTENVTKVLPLIVEESTGLITYISMDNTGKVELRALELATGDLGEGIGLITESVSRIVVVYEGSILVYEREVLEMLSMGVLPELDLPRKSISKVLTRN